MRSHGRGSRGGAGAEVRRALLWLIPVTALACAVALRSEIEGPFEPRAPEPPRPTVNHALHLSRDLVCADCHDPEETGTPTLPDSKACFECHDKDLSKETDRVRAYFEATRQEDGTYRFSRPAYMDDLIVAHKEHAGYGVECVACHGPPGERAYPRPEPFAFMERCTDCHEQKAPARLDCSNCHEVARKDVSPASHAEARFRTLHGKSAPKNWREGEGKDCAICHQVPQDCHTCHESTEPLSHREAGWERFHGKGELLGREMAFADMSCSLCHAERSCSACHQVEKPRSHTESWVRRYHGLEVGLDRASCTTCHKQDFCSSCHETTEPVSHRGNWDDAHCLNCHEPLQSNSCFACHKNTLGHLAATPKPPDATHAGATDPAGCLNCHTVLPHFDAGGRCGTCHR